MIRRLVILISSLLFLFPQAYAQQYAFQVSFTNKTSGPYSLSSPSAYLSARALARRAAQGIAIDTLDLPVNPAYVDSALNLTSGIFYETSRWLNSCVILLETGDSSHILALAGKPYISNVQLVGAYCADLFRQGAPTSAPQAVPVERTTTEDGVYYNATWQQTELVNGYYLHDNGYNGEGMLIAVLDAGFIGADTHPYFDSLWASNRMVDSYDFTFHNNNIFTQDNHGMMVLSTMAGYRPDTFVGTAPLAMYALYITENNTDDQPVNMLNMIAGAERADSIGADVITESLGYDLLQSSCSGMTFPEDYSSMDGKTTVAAKAANFATMKGMLFVATAGNDGGGEPGYGDYIMTPGDADSALTIGAVNTAGVIAGFSGYGPNAAGVVKPDVCDVGSGAVVCWYSPPPLISTQDGTSFSTPQVAGWAACLWESKRSATPYQIRQDIIRCASDYNNPGPQLGYGIPNFDCSGIILGVQNPQQQATVANVLFVSPNPFSDEIKIFVQPDIDQDIDFSVFDMAGRSVATAHGHFVAGSNTLLELPAASLPDGIYVLKATSPYMEQTIKLAKQ